MRSPYSRPDIQRQENEPESVFSILLEKYERCGFCNTKLIFSHDLNLSYLQVIESSQCPGCGVSLNPKKFTLQ